MILNREFFFGLSGYTGATNTETSLNLLKDGYLHKNDFMAAANIYLTFNGNCKEAFDFYRSVLGGDFNFVGHFKDIPADAGMPTDPADADKIMHIALPIGKHSTLMGSDTGAAWSADFRQGNNFSVSLNVDSKEEADRMFAGLSEGGAVTMPMANTFWGDYFGMLTDKFGINWMVSFNTRQG